MTSEIFAVMRMRGPAWNDAAAMEEQVDWRRHADYMNALADDGFIVLGGPLAGTRDVLLIVRAESEAGIVVCLADDCWSVNGLLKTLWIRPWRLRLGGLDSAAPLRASP